MCPAVRPSPSPRPALSLVPKGCFCSSDGGGSLLFHLHPPQHSCLCSEPPSSSEASGAQHPHQAHCPVASQSRPVDTVGAAAPSSIGSQAVSFLPPLPALSPMCTCLWWQHSQSWICLWWQCLSWPVSDAPWGRQVHSKSRAWRAVAKFPLTKRAAVSDVILVTVGPLATALRTASCPSMAVNQQGTFGLKHVPPAESLDSTD